MDENETNRWEHSVPLNPAAESRPLKHAVICCTSVPDEKRTEIGKYVEQMGAIHRYDLTLDVTHLIVGDYNTPKYRYVAKERPDVRPMTIEWIEAVRELWMEDKDIDVEALEQQHLLPTFKTLKFSMTGCDDPTERLEIAEQVKANGAIYEGDLTKQITHLISFRTEGAKYRAAKSWGLRIVSVEWMRDSLERGMILDEQLYNPILPPEERGKGAWDRTKPKRTSLGKRSRRDSTDGVEGARRKLRRTASTKLNSQNDSIWGDIVGGGGTVLQVARSGIWDAADETPNLSKDNPRPEPEESSSDPPTISNAVHIQPPPVGFFSGYRFYLHGFTGPKTQILLNHLLPQDAEISNTVDEFSAPTKCISIRKFMVVPSNLPVSDRPDLPLSNGQVEPVTEWWVERCLHQKKFVDPQGHVIGRPFRAFPIAGFEEMTISSAAFAGVDLLHVTKAVELLGAKYSEAFTKHSSILLTKTTSGLRKDKLDAARDWKVPIVEANWLWDSIEAGAKQPLLKYRFRGQKLACSPKMNEIPSVKPQVGRSKSEGRPVPTAERPCSSSTARPPRTARLDNTAFISDEPAPAIESEAESQNKPEAEASNSTSDLSYKSEPLSEINANSPTRTVSTAPAPSNHPNSRPKEDISNAISDLLAMTKTTAQPTHSDVPEARRRGRILGRAASNVSITGSSTPFSRATSVDSTATHGNPVEYPAHGKPSIANLANEASTDTHKSAQARIEKERIEKFLAEGNGIEEENESQPPSSTQLLYDDPESREYKERIMARMLGEKVDEAGIQGRRKMRVATISGGETGERSVRKRGRPPGGGGGLR
ncbi:S-M checkpoint control rad4 [Hyphodiscus hymeniophilus]|uniref:S-M checkpoint control rad4 n=1 Tax=Hyphodiscus hymeniophilus TaxID=353542 RepID=A0A9P6VJU0_9HELO|nr:S-M checkpoint control rad4 [Hyphodiscus hymeniophilus]